MRIVVLLGLCLPCVAWGQTPLATLKAYLSDFQSYEARFEQQMFDEEGEHLSSSRGALSLERPGHFRWDQTFPENIQLLADGHLFWSYDEALEQVVVRPQAKALEDTPAAWLSHAKTDWLENFNVVQAEQCFSAQCFSLTSKEDESPFQEITLGFTEGVLSEILLRDWFDQDTQILFDRPKMNSAIPADRFVFVPPEGADIIEAQ